MRHRWALLWAIPLCSACGGQLLETDDLCTPPNPDTNVECVAEQSPAVCPMPDGTHWERLSSGVWLHFAAGTPRILCDVAPDGHVIARSP
jgi:hypothetical protein